MKVGIKYCGGCNCAYERKKEVEKLKKVYSGYEIGLVRKEEEYDWILLVCGCTRTCIRNYRDSKAKEYFVLQGEKDFQNIIKEWEGLIINYK